MRWLGARRPILLLVGLTFLACQAPRAAPPPQSASGPPGVVSFEGRTLNIATGGTGGVYILYGGGLADILTKKMKGAARAQSTAGSVANMQLIRDGKADLAFTLADTAFDAFVGRGPFKSEEEVDACTIAALYWNYTHVVAKDGAGVSSVPDLRGKRVSVGAAASGTEIIADRLLEAYDLDPANDIQRERLGVADSANALRDGKIDAFFWSGGLPTSQILDLRTSTKIQILDHADVIPKMVEKYGSFYFPTRIATDAYETERDAQVAGVANLLVVPASMDAGLVKAILTTIFESQADLAKIHAEAKNLSLGSAVQSSALDFHPGAIEFYQSKGVWNPLKK